MGPGPGPEHIRRWESGALAHAVTDPFGQGPVPWLRGSETYFDDTGQVVPWYVDAAPAPARGGPRVPAPRTEPSAGGPRSADDVRRQIKGFVSTGAVAPGEAVDFHITVDPPQEFSVDVYRIGHYDGDGAAKITTSPRLSGIVQPPPLTADRTVSCHHWWLSWRLQVPSYWNVGAYVAVLTTLDGYRSHVPFTVRDHHPADLLLLLPDVTWQAYNLYPEDGRSGASLYHAWDEDGRLLGEADAATTVSFDRPYSRRGPAAACRPRLRLHPLGRALRLRPRLRRRPRPARRSHRPHPLPRPGLPRPRRVLVDEHAPHRGARPRQRHLTGLPVRQLPLLAGGVGSLPVRRPQPPADLPQAQGARQTRPVAGDRPRRAAVGRHPVRGPGARAASADRPQRRPLAVGGDRRGRRRRHRGPGRGRGRPLLPAHPAPAPRGPHTPRPLPVRRQRGRPPPPGDLPLPGPLRRPGLRLRHLRLVMRRWTAPAMWTPASNAPRPTSWTASANATDARTPARATRCPWSIPMYGTIDPPGQNHGEEPCPDS